jgi:hypothetical protein
MIPHALIAIENMEKEQENVLVVKVLVKYMD